MADRPREEAAVDLDAFQAQIKRKRRIGIAVVIVIAAAGGAALVVAPILSRSAATGRHARDMAEAVGAVGGLVADFEACVFGDAVPETDRRQRVWQRMALERDFSERYHSECLNVAVKAIRDRATQVAKPGHSVGDDALEPLRKLQGSQRYDGRATPEKVCAEIGVLRETVAKVAKEVGEDRPVGDEIDCAGWDPTHGVVPLQLPKDRRGTVVVRDGRLGLGWKEPNGTALFERELGVGEWKDWSVSADVPFPLVETEPRIWTIGRHSEKRFQLWARADGQWRSGAELPSELREPGGWGAPTILGSPKAMWIVGEREKTLEWYRSTDGATTIETVKTATPQRVRWIHSYLMAAPRDGSFTTVIAGKSDEGQARWWEALHLDASGGLHRSEGPLNDSWRNSWTRACRDGQRHWALLTGRHLIGSADGGRRWALMADLGDDGEFQKKAQLLCVGDRAVIVGRLRADKAVADLDGHHSRGGRLHRQICHGETCDTPVLITDFAWEWAVTRTPAGLRVLAALDGAPLAAVLFEETAPGGSFRFVDAVAGFDSPTWTVHTHGTWFPFGTVLERARY